MEQVAERVCGVSILEDIQNLTGHGHEQLALADPAQSRAGLDELRRCPPASAMLQFPLVILEEKSRQNNLLKFS